jgi:hypothetical protein
MAEMIGADTSIYKLPQQPNMLQQAGGYAQLDNTILANKTAQFDLAKKQVDNMYGRLSALYGNPELDDPQKGNAALIREGSAMMARGEIDP